MAHMSAGCDTNALDDLDLIYNVDGDPAILSGHEHLVAISDISCIHKVSLLGLTLG